MQGGAREMNYSEFFDPPSSDDGDDVQEDEDDDEEDEDEQEGDTGRVKNNKKSVCFNPEVEEKQIRYITIR